MTRAILGAISLELRRDAATRTGTRVYRASVAQWKARQAASPKTAKLATNPRLRPDVEHKLAGEVTDGAGRPIAGPNVPWRGGVTTPQGPPLGCGLEPGTDQQPAQGRVPR